MATFGVTAVKISTVFHFLNGSVLALTVNVRPKRFVYILQSESAPQRYYTRVASSVPRRLGEHNAGRCVHTASARPWRVVVSIEFALEGHALRFERYLKSGSGSAFAKRHLR